MKIAVEFSVGLQWLGFSEFVYVVSFIKNTLRKCFFCLHYELDFSVDSSSILVMEKQILLYVFVFISLQSGCYILNMPAVTWAHFTKWGPFLKGEYFFPRKVEVKFFSLHYLKKLNIVKEKHFLFKLFLSHKWHLVRRFLHFFPNVDE